MKQNRYKVLLVEDEDNIRNLVATMLDTAGYQTILAKSCASAQMMYTSYLPDLIILDLGLPDMDGMNLLNFVRQNYLTPIIVLSARTNESDKIAALDAGANDYITKPFDMLVLLARVENVLRRTMKNTTVFKINNCTINLDSRSVKVGEKPVSLTLQEFNLLEALVLNRNLALSREKLIELAWGFDFEGDNRTVDVHIQKLRKKCNLEKEIATVYKYGYRLEYDK